jgi:hypothetical protein
MANKYSPEHLLVPNGGRFPLSMFPGLDESQTLVLLELWLSDGYLKGVGATDVDEAALAWAYQRGFENRALEMASIPATVTVPNETTQQRTDAQRATFERLASYWQAKFDGYFAEGDAQSSLIPPSGTSKTQITWGGGIFQG